MDFISHTILSSKIAPPMLGADGIERHRLYSMLHEHPFQILILTAQAGFGKTTFVLGLLEQHFATHCVIWNSLDAMDSEVVRLCRYLVAACERQLIPISPSLQKAVDYASALSLEAVLAQLQADILAHGKPVVWVFDDLHTLENDTAIQALSYWLTQLPSLISVIMLTREFPKFALAKLRLQRRCVTLLREDLAFDLQETQAFLQEKQIALSKADVSQLWHTTQGWVTGLQLWALSHAGSAHGATLGFQSYSDDLLQHFIAEEIFDALPEALQLFLLKTSVVQRFNPDLASALTQESHVAVYFDELFRRGLFIQRLSSPVGWVAYHDLFRQFLITRLAALEKAQVASLHHRAFLWWQQHQLIELALEHVPWVQNSQLTLKCLMQYGWALHQQGQYRLLSSLFNTLSESQLLSSVQVTFLYAMTEQVFSRATQNKTQLLALATKVWPTQLDASEWRCAQAALRGFEMDRAMWYAQLQKAEACVHEIVQADCAHDPGMLPKLRNVQAWLALHQGQFNEGIDYIRQAYQAAQQEQIFQGMFYFKHVEGVLYWALGDLSRAFERQNEALAFRREHYLSHLATLDLLYRYRIDVLWEWHQLDGAHRLVQEALSWMEQVDAKWKLPILSGQLKVEVQRQDWIEAQLLQVQIKQLLDTLPPTPDVALDAYIALLVFAIESEQQEHLLGWINERARGQFESESPWLMLRYQIACEMAQVASQHAVDESGLRALCEQAKERGFVKEQAQAGLWLSLLQWQQGLPWLDDFQMCWPLLVQMQLIGTCLVAKAGLQPLLQQAIKQGSLAEPERVFAERILYLCKHRQFELNDPDYPERVQTIPLSKKEWLVLQRIGEGYSNEQISEMQFVELSTVKSHIKSIYRKLGIKNRQQAKVVCAHLSESCQI